MLTSQQIIDPLILFCRQDPQLFDQLTTFFHLETAPQHWQFKLQDLYSFLLHYHNFEDFGFENFRRKLFNSPVNQSLGQHGYKVDIAVPAKHVDDNLYTILPIDQ